MSEFNDEISTVMTCKVMESVVDIRFIMGEWVFLLDKLDGKWSAVKRELLV